MCKILSLDEAKKVMMEIQINLAGSELEFDGNGHLRSNWLVLSNTALIS